MVTLEEIKKRYPEGCEVSCAYRKEDKGIVNYNSLEEDFMFDIVFVNEEDLTIYLFDSNKSKFATITKPAPESKPTRYKDKEVHGMDVIALAKFWSLNFNEASILKYLLRDKDQDIEDMWKIVDFAQREHEYLTINKNK